MYECFMPVYSVCAWYPWRPEGLEYLVTGVIDACSPSCWCLKLNMHPNEFQTMVFTR